MGKYKYYNPVVFLWVIIVILFALSACNDPGKKTNTINKGSENGNISLPAKPAIANPAAVKCAEDGYLLEPVTENGVSVGHFCVNPETGMKCEIWKYFREECALEP